MLQILDRIVFSRYNTIDILCLSHIDASAGLPGRGKEEGAPGSDTI